MKNTIKVIAAVIVSAVLVSVTFTGGYLVSNNIFPARAQAIKDNSPAEFQSNMGVFWEAWGIIHDQFFRPAKLDDTSLTYGSIAGMVDALGDPHTAFVDPRRADRLNTDLQGSFEGIGATVEMRSGRLVIVSPIKGSPAEAAGIKPGDVVLKVNDTVIENMTVDEAVSIIRGPKGSKITLTIQRANTPTFKVDITRDTIRVPFVEGRTIDSGGSKIAYIRMSEFGSTAPQELHTQLVQLLGQKPKALIFDLRNNPGGFLDAAQQVSGEFLKPDSVALIEQLKDGQRQEFKVKGGGAALDVPMVLLVNGGSASASEIISADLRDYKRATIIGLKTYGKGSVQTPHQLSDQSQLRVTIAHFLSPKGLEIHQVGISPDIEVADPSDAEVLQGKDPQLDRAVQFILSGASLERTVIPALSLEWSVWGLPG
jgi:carboxyl-terminal processing protease